MVPFGVRRVLRVLWLGVREMATGGESRGDARCVYFKVECGGPYGFNMGAVMFKKLSTSEHRVRARVHPRHVRAACEAPSKTTQGSVRLTGEMLL